jgi:hypothetical protein
MTKWYERANEASFKATSGGYVFQAPSPWMLAPPRYYLVSEAQKARLLEGLGRWRAHLLIASLTNGALTLAIILAIALWPATFARPIVPLYLQLGVGPFTLLLCALLTLVMAPLLAVPQICMARALRPVLAEAPVTDERIKLNEQLPKIASSVSGKVLAFGLLGGLAMIGGGGVALIDAYLEGRLAARALPDAIIVSIGALFTASFLYLINLRARQKRPLAA